MNKNKPTSDDQEQSKRKMKSTKLDKQSVVNVSHQGHAASSPGASILSRRPSSLMSNQPSAIMQRQPSVSGTETVDNLPRIRFGGRNFAHIGVQTDSPSHMQPKLVQRGMVDEERLQTKPNHGLEGDRQGRVEPMPQDVEVAIFSNSSPVIQRTIDQDARLWAMDWLATWTRSFPKMAKQYALPKLLSICTGVLGEENPVVPVPPATQVNRATYTTALAAGLVRMGAEKAGQLSARLADEKNGLYELMQELENKIPNQIPALQLATVQTQQDFHDLKLSDPFLVLKSGGAQFTFSKDMALHMMRRHHPKYLSGPPMQVQSYFDKDTTIMGIKAIITGTVNKSDTEIKEWRTFRRKKGTDLNTAEATTLNLRPVWDGKHWELTLTLNNTNPQDAKGVVAHFTPTL